MNIQKEVIAIVNEVAKKVSEKTGNPINPKIEKGMVNLINKNGGMNVDLEVLMLKYKAGDNLHEFLENIMLESPKNASDFFKQDFVFAKQYIFPLLKLPMILPVESKSVILSEESPFEDLLIYYVIDNEETMMFLTDDFLEAWGLTFEDIKKQAEINLKHLVTEKGLIPLGNARQRFYGSSTNDGFDATRILGLDYRKLKKKLAGDILIAIPNRDTLVVFSSESDILEEFKYATQMQYNNNRYQLSHKIYKWDGKTFTPLD